MSLITGTGVLLANGKQGGVDAQKGDKTTVVKDGEIQGDGPFESDEKPHDGDQDSDDAPAEPQPEPQPQPPAPKPPVEQQNPKPQPPKPQPPAPAPRPPVEQQTPPKPQKPEPREMTYEEWWLNERIFVSGDLVTDGFGIGTFHQGTREQNAQAVVTWDDSRVGHRHYLNDLCRVERWEKSFDQLWINSEALFLKRRTRSLPPGRVDSPHAYYIDGTAGLRFERAPQFRYGFAEFFSNRAQRRNYETKQEEKVPGLVSMGDLRGRVGHWEDRRQGNVFDEGMHVIGPNGTTWWIGKIYEGGWAYMGVRERGQTRVQLTEFMHLSQFSPLHDIAWEMPSEVTYSPRDRD